MSTKKKIGTELGWFFIKMTLAILLLPFWIGWFDLRASSENLHPIEELFLIELGLLWFFISLLGLYILRFILSLLWKKIGGGSGGKAP